MEIQWEEEKVQSILNESFVASESEKVLENNDDADEDDATAAAAVVVVEDNNDGNEELITADNVEQEDDAAAPVVEQPQEDDEDDDEEEDDEGNNIVGGKRLKIECLICGATFRRKKTLKYHSMVHVDDCFYACEFCSATKIHWSEFYVHQCTSGHEKPLLCPQCNKTVSTKKQLAIHEEVHALQRRFTTKRLDNYFAKKLEEAEDKDVDWGSKPFLCGVCGKPFCKLYEVEYHEKLHNNERPAPHLCNLCNIRYINKQDLNKHLARGCTRQLTRKTENN